MSEITPEELFKGLLAFGFFAEKVPPIFYSESFYEFYIRETEAGKTLNESHGWSDFVRYDSMRNVNISRPMGIPMPFNYARLCECLRDNWQEIQTYFAEVTINQTHKISRIHIRKRIGEDSLFEMNYHNESADGFGEDEIAGINHYKVSADISSCFASIYTHSIPWTVQGKEEAKRSGRRHWSDKLDEKCRNVKYGETTGLLIGPHSSNLISEIVLCKIDQKLSEKGYSFIRFVDDYKCFVKNKAEADRFLIELNQCLKEYDLLLNNKKSEISKLPNMSNTDWVLKLKSVYLGEKYDESGRQILLLSNLKTYIDTAISLCKEHEDAAPLKYAIKVIASKKIGEKAKQYYCNKIINIAVCYPYLATIMDEYVFRPFKVSTNAIQKVANHLFKYGVERCQYDACAFSFFWALKYDVELDFNEEELINTKDCVLLTVAYVYAKKKNENGLIESLIKEAESLKSSFERYWLFVYEALPASCLPGYYRKMKEEGISFIKPEECW